MRGVFRIALGLMLALPLLAACGSGGGEVGSGVKLRQVQLLSMEDEIAANTSVKDLAAFIRAAEVAAGPAAGPVARSGWFTVQFTLQPRARPIVKVVERDGIDDVTAQRIAAALSDVQPLYTRQAPVLFRAVFDVGGA